MWEVMIPKLLLLVNQASSVASDLDFDVKAVRRLIDGYISLLVTVNRPQVSLKRQPASITTQQRSTTSRFINFWQPTRLWCRHSSPVFI
jgi:hypothetical protein